MLHPWREIEQWAHDLSPEEVGEYEHCSNHDCRFLRQILADACSSALNAERENVQPAYAAHAQAVHELVAQQLEDARENLGAAERRIDRLRVTADAADDLLQASDAFATLHPHMPPAEIERVTGLFNKARETLRVALVTRGWR